MSAIASDALVFFGATGDLAYKQIFPALQRLAKRGELNMPVIGVAKSGCTLDDLKKRAQQSVEHGGGLDPDAFAKQLGRDGQVMQRVPGRSEQLAQLMKRRGVSVIAVDVLQRAGQLGEAVRV